MPDPLRQDKRVARLDTPLGKDKLVLVGFECAEGVSEKFEVKIEALSNDKGINFDSAIGQNCTITIEMDPGEKRYFDGILIEAHWLGTTSDDLEAYHLVLGPWLQLLSFRSNCLIFHEMTVPEIIQKIFAEHGFARYTSNLSRGYPVLEYCVQYRESDMDFVCRLMEEYGISYYFQHSDGEHKLILTDEMSTFETMPGGSRSFIPKGGGRKIHNEDFFTWKPERRFTSGKIKLDDYDLKKSESDLVVDEDIDPPFDPGTLEVFDYPGRYLEKSDGEKLAQAWRDMERAHDGHFHAEGDCVTCFPGALVNLEDKSKSGFDGEYLALRCAHKFGRQTYRTGKGEDAAANYEGTYEFIKSDKPYAPPRITEKAVVQGPQTAKVVGDGEIDVDEYGRILVRFHWDQHQDQSRRCRLAQVWSGNRWGGIYIPRVGMEVVVIFLEGDADQPLVIGTVYNDKNMPPFALPDDKSIAGVKSNSTPGGGGYNEFIFDDKKGNELVRMHAQKDLTSVVENNETRSIAINRSTSVGSNDTLSVGDTLSITAGSKVEITVGTSKITMTPEKISIESLTIEITATTSLKTTALTSEHLGSALMDIKGAIVKINS